MTGYGRCEIQEGGKSFSVEIKTVNHRYSDISIKIPKHISFLEEKIRDTISKSLSRGKADIFIAYENFSEGQKSAMIDEALAKAYIQAVELLRDKFGIKDDITVSLIARFPDVIRLKNAEEDEGELWSLLKTALDTANGSLVNMRENEGKKLEYDLILKGGFIAEKLEEIKKRAPEVVKEYKYRLENRIKEFIGQNTVDENRISMEVALFADRCSIDEEIVRLKSHIDQMGDTLKLQEPVGRKLDFLIQEMIREVNTIGSKANDLVIIKEVLDIKSEIEKLREQVQNIE